MVFFIETLLTGDTNLIFFLFVCFLLNRIYMNNFLGWLSLYIMFSYKYTFIFLRYFFFHARKKLAG